MNRLCLHARKFQFPAILKTTTIGSCLGNVELNMIGRDNLVNKRVLMRLVVDLQCSS